MLSGDIKQEAGTTHEYCPGANTRSEAGSPLSGAVEQHSSAQLQHGTHRQHKLAWGTSEII